MPRFFEDGVLLGDFFTAVADAFLVFFFLPPFNAFWAAISIAR
jgi:hypothetical protein